VTEISDLLASLVGKRIEGGCERCDAYQTVEPDEWGARVTIHHDQWCFAQRRFDAIGNRAARRVAAKRRR